MTISPVRVLLVGAALVILLLLFWPSSSTPPTPNSPTPSPLAASTARPGYRLAGVAARGDASFAAFEDPDGQTVLYRVGDNVPGLGILARVQERSAFITTDQGEVEFRVQPAASATPDRRSPTARSPATPAPRRARTVAGSRPSDAPDR